MKSNKVNLSQQEMLVDYEPIFKESKQKKNQDKKVVSKILFKNKFLLLLSLILFIFKYLPQIALPIITSNIIDLVVYRTDSSMQTIIFYAILSLILLILNLPITVISNTIYNKLLRNASASLKATVIRKLQHLSLTSYKNIVTGKLQSKFLSDTESAEQYFRILLVGIIPAIILIVINSFITLYRSWIALLFIIVLLPLNVILVQFFRKPLRRLYRNFRLQKEETSNKLTTMLEMLEITKAHGLEETEISNVEKEIQTLKNNGLKIDKSTSYFGSLSWIISQLSAFICLLFSSIMTLNDVPGFTAGSIMLFQALYSSINVYVQQIVNYLPQISSGKEAVRSICEIMNNDDIEDNYGKKDFKRVEGNYKFKNVYYRYPNASDYAIKNLNLTVKKGECIAVVGSSGSGKSTLINMIIGFLKATKGTLEIDGHSIKSINVSDYRKSISVVTQNTILFEGSIKENITYGLSKYTKEDLDEVIKLANIEEFLKDIPEGIEFNIGERGNKLSGGQKQRIAIARALIRKPSVLILDEATSALDNESEYYVQQAINNVIKDKTTFIVAHRLSTIRNADRIIVMENGEIIETGTYEELVNLKGKFFTLKNLSEISNKTA